MLVLSLVVLQLDELSLLDQSSLPLQARCVREIACIWLHAVHAVQVFLVDNEPAHALPCRFALHELVESIRTFVVAVDCRLESLVRADPTVEHL